MADNNVILICLRLATMLILGITSQLALSKRQYPLAIWSFSFWLFLFRFFAIRVLLVFPHQEDKAVLYFMRQLMFGWFPVFTDIVLLLSAIPMYIWISHTFQTWKKGVK